MREFKCRAWEKHMKEMISVYNINFEDGIINTDGAWRMFAEIILMQWTGLQDKNGVDIYEGDIVRVRETIWDSCLRENIERELDYIGEMVFSQNSWCIKTRSKVANSYKSLFYWNPDIERKSGDLEVLGNIFENPELLKGE